MIKNRITALLAAVLLAVTALPATSVYAYTNESEAETTVMDTAPEVRDAEAKEETVTAADTMETTEEVSDSTADGPEVGEETIPDLGTLLSGNEDLIGSILGDLDPEIVEILMKNPKLLAYFLPTFHVTVTDSKVIITFKETADPDPVQTGTVTTGGSNLNVRTGPSTDYNIISSLANGTNIEIIDEADGWYRIEFPAEFAWVCGRYVSLKEITPTETEKGYSFDITGEMIAEFLSSFSDLFEEPQEAPVSVIQGLTPDGNLTLVDDYGERAGEGQQFITLVTKAGNYFYLIIDRDDKGEENVHFLNLVDERDLFALMDEDEAAAYESQIAAEQAAKEAAEKAAAEAATASQSGESETQNPEDEQAKEGKKTNLAPVLIIIVLMAGVGGAWFFMQTKKKKQAASSPDPDADYTDDEEDYGAGEEEMTSEPYDEDPYESEILDDEDSSDDGEEDA